jgi:hypothetical protein
MRRKLAGRMFLAAIAAVALSATAAGCGGGSSLTKTDSPNSYADAVCGALTKHLDELAGIPAGAGSLDMGNIAASNTETTRSALAAVSSIDHEIAKDMRNIQPPADMADMHKQIIDSYQKAGDAAATILDALGRPQDEAVATIQASENDMSGIQNMWQQLPANYSQAFTDSEACKSLEPTPTPAA